MGLAVVLVLSGISAGCVVLGGDEDAGTPEPPYEPAGNWTRVYLGEFFPFASVPSGLIGFEGGDSAARFGRTTDENGDDEVLLWAPGMQEPEPVARIPGIDGDAMAGAAIDEDVFLFVREKKPDYQTHVYRADTQTGEVSREPVSTEEASEFPYWSASTAVGALGKVYLFGGCCTRPEVWSYDPISHEFDRVSAIPISVERFSQDIVVGYAGGDFYVASPDDPRILRFEPGENRWTTIADRKPSWLGVWSLLAHPDGTVWTVGLRCVSEYTPERGEFVTGLGVPWQLWREGKEWNGSHVSAFGGVQWRGSFYVYSTTAGARQTADGEWTWLDGPSIYRWDPPEPNTWEPSSVPEEAADKWHEKDVELVNGECAES